ncbi:MAG: glycoside hydrolase family 2 [Lachnospiraceae bacterium]
MAREVMILGSDLWRMERMRPGQGVEEGIIHIPAEREGLFSGWNDATVPGDVYTDLTMAGEIDDPYVGRNLAKAKWVQDYEWWYVLRFNTEKEFASRNLQILFEGVDYDCEIWLNQTYLGRHVGMMDPFTFDITGMLNSTVPITDLSECDNMLFVKLAPAPKNIFNIAGFRPVFAGDYLPGFATVGIWGDIKIFSTDYVRIGDYKVESILDGTKNQTQDALVSVEIEIELIKETSVEVEVIITFSDSEKEHILSVPYLLNGGKNIINGSILLEKAQLWWPWDIGTPFLYDLSLKVVRNDICLDFKNDKVGIRQITMKHNEGFSKEESEIPWTFVINGREIFLRSACWGGQPSLLYGRNSYEKYRDFLEKAKGCNLNNLRMFGWHPPETKDFYDICDELGITVWTNFLFSSQVFKTDQVYIDSVLDECEAIVRVRRNHPSNIYWMGGEEVYFSRGQLESKNKELMQLVGNRVNEVTDIPYGDATPLSNEWGSIMGYKACESKHVNSHYYAAGALLMEDAFQDPDCCIVPELTAASVPCVESLKKFIPQDELWPIGPSWAYLQGNIDILRAINIEVFGEERFDSLDEFVEATQISQGEVFKFAIESFRRLKPKMSGLAICHFITNRPLIKWEIVDYYGKEKLSYKYVKQAYEPLLPTVSYARRRNLPGTIFKGECYIVNDLYNAYEDVIYSYEIKNNRMEVVQKGQELVSIDVNSCKKMYEFEYMVIGEMGDKFYVEVTLIDEQGNVIGSNDYTLLVDDELQIKEKSMEAYKRHRGNKVKWGHSIYRDIKDAMKLP